MEEKIMYGYVFFKKYSTLPCSFIQTNKGKKKNILTVKLLSEMMYIAKFDYRFTTMCSIQNYLR